MSGRGRRRGPSLGTRIAILLTMVLAPRVACAQTSRVATPTQMFDAESSPGLAVGNALVLRNETVARIQEDSNIYNVDTNRTVDTIGVVTSDFRLATNLPRHMAELDGGVGLLRYVNTPAENTTTYYGGGRGRLDLGDRITVDADGQLGRGYEMRGTAGDQFTTDHPVLYDRRQIHARIARTGGVLELAVDGSIRTQDYLDAYAQGVRISLAYRNATVRQGGVEVQYRLSPALRLYGQFSANGVGYAQNIGYPRDSNGYAALFGVHLAVTSLIDLEAAAGYMHQSFQTPGTPAVNGINYKLTANWTPTPMWRLTADGRRDIDASPLTNVPAIVRSTFDLKAQRALGERMILEGSAAYTQEEYRSLSRTDRRVEAGLGVHYRVTSNVGAIAQAGYRQQWGGALGRVYSGFSGSVGLRFVL
ncbi:MAG: outer membrane beta-barrel protein [Sphingomonadales bacterium]|nr:outer membrane beta-barrel protein [Sphingomonadales bacterium]